MGTTTNVTSLLSPLISTPALKGALFLNRNLRVEEKEAGQYGKICNFSPLDSEQSAYSWETTVRSSSGANSSGRPGCSGSLPDFLHHHTRDDLGHSVHREEKECHQEQIQKFRQACQTVYKNSCQTVNKQVCSQQYRQESQPYTETECSSQQKTDCESRWEEDGYGGKKWVEV